MPPGNALRCEGLGKRHGPRWALRGVDLALAAGDVVALVGPNGAGKSTLLRCAATLLRPTEGRCLVEGLDGQEEGAAARGRLGFAGDQPRHYAELTVEENLRFTARFHPGGLARVPALLDEVGLASRAGDPARALSRGLAMRLALARALVGEPRVLLLDEPFAPLDGASREVVAGILARAADRGAAVLFSAQSLEGLPSACRRAVALREGRLARDLRGTPADLRAQWAEAVAGKEAA